MTKRHMVSTIVKDIFTTFPPLRLRTSRAEAMAAEHQWWMQWTKKQLARRYRFAEWRLDQGTAT